MSFSPLLEQSELAAIREIGEDGMQTAFQIWRSTIQPEDPAAGGYNASTDYGDDQVNDPVDVLEPDDGIGSPVATVYGWFFSQLQTNVVAGSGQLTVVDIHILRLPVGVDIRPEDHVRRVDNGNDYTVIDTNNDDTWPEWQKCTLRRRE
jgi:hypothetical protein